MGKVYATHEPWKRLSLRRAIIALYNDGESNGAFTRRFGIAKPTVTRWIKQHENSGDLNDLSLSGRPYCTVEEDDQACDTPNNATYAFYDHLKYLSIL